MKFKVGDKVKIVNPYEMDKKYKGDIVTIKRFDEFDSDRFFVKENGRPWRSREVILIEEYRMTKEDLKTGDIVTLRNGDRLIYEDGNFTDITDDHHNPLICLSDLAEDLTYRRYDGDSNYDIIKVERAKEYETVFEREEVKELTVDEISEKLGYKVKVVGVEK